MQIYLTLDQIGCLKERIVNDETKIIKLQSEVERLNNTISSLEKSLRNSDVEVERLRECIASILALFGSGHYTCSAALIKKVVELSKQTLEQAEKPFRECKKCDERPYDEIAMESMATDCPRVAVDDVLAILKDCGIADQSIIVSRIKAMKGDGK